MRDLLYMVAVAGLSLSGLASAIRLIEWLIRTDPRIIAQTGRWAAVGLAILSAPLLLALLINEKWTAAMALAAMMLFAFAWYGPRLLQHMVRYRVAADWSSPRNGNLTPAFDASVADPELVRRSIGVLQEYLRRTAALSEECPTYPRAVAVQHLEETDRACHNGGAPDRNCRPISEAEALDILGLGANASEIAIKEAHQRLWDLVAPELGGSHYLVGRINVARDLLLRRTEQRWAQTVSARALPQAPGSQQA